MTVFELINRDVSFDKRSFAIIACISGAANAMIMALINVAASHASDTEKDNQALYFFALFVIIVAIYSLSQKRLMLRATYHVEKALNRVRIEMMNRIRHCELATIEKIGRERIYTTMSKELQIISQSSQLFVIIGQSSLLIFFTAIYIAWLSLPAFFILSIFISIGAFIHWIRSREITSHLAHVFEHENNLISRLTDMLDGFKEVKLSRPRAEELQNEYNQDSESVEHSRKEIHSLYANDFVISQISFYGAIAAMVFLVPMISAVYSDVVLKVTTASLFLIGPITSVVGGIPVFANTNAAANNVLALERELKEVHSEMQSASILKDFKKLELKDLHFHYQAAEGERAFEVGPINFTLQKGKTVFITGGNGSGKTTFIRLLTGLYHANRGVIKIDGHVISDAQLDAYRNLFTSVFSDFHLFKHLYGTLRYEQSEADEWLDLMEMSHKVHLNDRRFSSVDLSSGQRKRLGLISSVLENRPIYIFDEWAADQDPHFREKFYTQILPKLKSRNQTVVAITHDDKYFHMADLHMKMSDGRLIKVNKTTPQKT